ncbi:MAG TPA: CinA family nicotinamide mononucleotide deamidase-related protein [Candidatus Desulfofervidus auxilii]|uniref:CinA-like protein n=1 Tax=Desulfofervidus auxilii TaxID=1621989 RepID=A0A7V0IAR2_DESA2|nr:CinA family nicotinamide mononucleotide deamidase-related protein [Candidatus Desulfofervidus auxilii]
MIGEVIIIGDEILAGEVIDTNSLELIRKLNEAGFSLGRISIVGDDEKDIQDALLFSLKRAKFVILTGGLGPTWDDKTISAVANVLKLPLKRHQIVYEHIKKCLQKRGKPVSPAHEKMALLPEGSEPIGLAFHACGFRLLYKNIPLYFLPGIPKQMSKILKLQVIPDLKKIFPQTFSVFKKILRIFGLSETEIQEKLGSLLAGLKDVKISSIPVFPEVHLILRAQKEEKLSQIVEKIKTLLGRNIFGEDTETMPEVVGRLLLEKHYKLAVAESITGGLIGHLITTVAGSSDYFERGVITYSNEAKIEILNVPKEVIDKYGPVSEQTARYMAKGVKQLAKTELGLSITGYAGPTAGLEAPVGTVFIGLASSKGVNVTKWQFDGDRLEVKTLAAMTALDQVRRFLL